MSNDTQLVSEMTTDEQLASLRAYLKVEEGLEDAIDLLNARKVNFATKEKELKLISYVLVCRVVMRETSQLDKSAFIDPLL